MRKTDIVEAKRETMTRERERGVDICGLCWTHAGHLKLKGKIEEKTFMEFC